MESGQFDGLDPRVRDQIENAIRAEMEGRLNAREVDRLASELQTRAGRNVVREAAAATIRDWDIFPNKDAMADALEEGDDSTVRHTIWSWLLMTFFRYPQGFLILFLVGFIAPSLISKDVRSRAFLLYFSKPISPVEYILGKLFILTFFIVGVTTLPAIALYLFAVMLSPDLSVLPGTWDIPLRILASTVFLVIPTASLALMLSSLTQETRFASFAWFAIWALGHGAWFAILISQTIRMNSDPFEPEVMQSAIVQQWSVLSMYNNLGDIQNWVFGFSPLHEVWPGIAALGAITAFSLFVLYRRIKSNIRI